MSYTEVGNCVSDFDRMVNTKLKSSIGKEKDWLVSCQPLHEVRNTVRIEIWTETYREIYTKLGGLKIVNT